MNSRLSLGRGTLIVAAFVMAGFAAGALAYWSGIGSGSSATQLGDPQAIVLRAGTPSEQLYPGDDANVSVIAENPNPYPVHIGSLSLDTGAGTGGFDVDGGHEACELSVLGFTTQDHGGTGWNVPPKVGVTDGSLPINVAESMTMSTDALNACQGAVFTVHLVAGS